MIHHPGPDGKCQGCSDKLKEANVVFTPWFWTWVEKFPELHISWSFRDEKSQNQALAEGKSKLAWPHSAHNHTFDGKPCANALDLFEIHDGKLLYRPSVMFYIADKSPMMLWGGRFTSIGDLDHFQIKSSHPVIEPDSPTAA